MATKKVSQGTRASKRPAERPVFAAEVQRSAERKALAKLPELAQRAALAIMHLEKKSLAQVIKGIEQARRDGRWVDSWHEPPSSVDEYLMAIRCCAQRARPDARSKAKVISLKAYRDARALSQ